jgi:5-methyltetrahydrofolate--homocysteine methyltransferase
VPRSGTGVRGRPRYDRRVIRQGTHGKRNLIPEARELRVRQTAAEQALWKALRDRRLSKAKFRRQHQVESYILDFYCVRLKVAIELDGPIHEDQRAYGARRTQKLRALGIVVIRFTNDDVLANDDAVCEEIARVVQLRSCERRRPSPRSLRDRPSPRRGEG